MPSQFISTPVTVVMPMFTGAPYWTGAANPLCAVPFLRLLQDVRTAVTIHVNTCHGHRADVHWSSMWDRSSKTLRRKTKLRLLQDVTGDDGAKSTFFTSLKRQLIRFFKHCSFWAIFAKRGLDCRERNRVLLQVADLHRLVVVHLDEPPPLTNHLSSALFLETLQTSTSAQDCHLATADLPSALSAHTKFLAHTIRRGVGPRHLRLGGIRAVLCKQDAVIVLAAERRAPRAALLLAVPRRDPRCSLQAGNDGSERTRTTVLLPPCHSTGTMIRLKKSVLFCTICCAMLFRSLSSCFKTTKKHWTRTLASHLKISRETSQRRIGARKSTPNVGDTEQRDKPAALTPFISFAMYMGTAVEVDFCTQVPKRSR